MTDFTFGETNLPIVSVVGNTTLQTLRPELYSLLDYIVFWINKELNTAFAATALSAGISFNNLLELKNCYYVPLQFITLQNLTKLPALFLENTETNYENWTTQKFVAREKYKLSYIMPALTEGQLVQIYPYQAQVCNTIFAALTHNTKDNISLIFSNLDFEINKGTFGALGYAESPNGKLLPMFQLEISIRNYLIGKPGLLNPQTTTGADIEIDNMDNYVSTIKTPFYSKKDI